MVDMKKTAVILILLLILGIFSGCSEVECAQVAATTLPVYQFTAMLCQDTPITVTRLVTESVSCLHEYSLTVSQMRAIEAAELVVISGAGLEAFMEEALENAVATLDASAGIELLEGGCRHAHGEHSEDAHEHDWDAHIWLSPVNAMEMAQNICNGLREQYPEYEAVFEMNLAGLMEELEKLDCYAEEQLTDLNSREIITFHDGFAYLADAYDLQILAAIEEESGAEISAQEILELIEMVEHHGIAAIFTEVNGSDSAASVLKNETGVACFSLDMAMSGDDYFKSMYHNINTLKEALR